jgi:hypothetical protein
VATHKGGISARNFGRPNAHFLNGDAESAVRRIAGRAIDHSPSQSQGMECRHFIRGEDFIGLKCAVSSSATPARPVMAARLNDQSKENSFGESAHFAQKKSWDHST